MNLYCDFYLFPIYQNLTSFVIIWSPLTKGLYCANQVFSTFLLQTISFNDSSSGKSKLANLIKVAANNDFRNQINKHLFDPGCNAMQWHGSSQPRFTFHMKMSLVSHLDTGTPGVIGSVGLVSRVGQPRQPANVSLGAWPLSKPDGIPDAGQPVSHQGEGTHQQDQDCGPVLRVPECHIKMDEDDLEECTCQFFSPLWQVWAAWRSWGARWVSWSEMRVSQLSPTLTSS